MRFGFGRGWTPKRIMLAVLASIGILAMVGTIVVGVAMDTVQQIESQLVMRHYEGFSPKSGRIRGRRSW